MSIHTIPLQSATDTQKLGQAIANQLQTGDIVCLSGPLGAGKTTLAQGIIGTYCNAEATSPTYTLAKYYDTPTSLWHFDFYRLEDPEQAYEAGLEEALNTGITIIEWPERIGGLIPVQSLWINLVTNTPRVARIETPPTWQTRKPIRI